MSRFSLSNKGTFCFSYEYLFRVKFAKGFCYLEVALLKERQEVDHPLLAAVVVVSAVALDALVVLVHEVDAPDALDERVGLLVDALQSQRFEK